MNTAEGSASEVFDVNFFDGIILPRGDAGLVGRDALDVLDAAPFQPGAGFLPAS